MIDHRYLVISHLVIHNLVQSCRSPTNARMRPHKTPAAPINLHVFAQSPDFITIPHKTCKQNNPAPYA